MTAESVQINVDAGNIVGKLPHAWNYIGYDECNYTYTPEGQELLEKFGSMQEKPYYVRTHYILCTGNAHGTYKWGSSNVYREDEQGNPIYDFSILDLIFDGILKQGLKPFVELAFMPQDLVDPRFYDVSAETRRMTEYRRFGHTCPPKDYQKWYDLVYTIVRHYVAQYGVAEVETWYWELWNEPNGDMYWRGTVAEFNKLYDYTAAAVKAACPTARVGGNAVAGLGRPKSNEFFEGFLRHCAQETNAVSGEQGAHLDFVSFHIKGGGYRADPQHRPVNPPSMKKLLRELQTGYHYICQYGFDGLECVLSEADPDGWAAGGAWDNHVLNFRNTEYYASYVAAAFDKIIRFGLEKNWDVRPLTWAFMFVAERCFEGTRTFSTQGIDKAVFNLFKMYAKLGERQLAFTSSASQDTFAYLDDAQENLPADIGGVAVLDEQEGLQLLVYSHHDSIEMDSATPVQLTIANLPGGDRPLTLKHYRVDAQHSNAYAEWVRQGQPLYPRSGQYDAIKTRDGLELLEAPRTVTPLNGQVTLATSLPAHAISLFVLEG